MSWTIRKALRSLYEESLPPLAGISAALDEKAMEMGLRRFLLCMPNDRLKDEEIPVFIEKVLGPGAGEDLIERVRVQVRGVRLPDEEIARLEAAQNYRCSVCGAPLNDMAKPHVDHIVPVSLGGMSHPDNYQLLCRRCNLGKTDSLHWIMAAPFFKESRGEVSFTLRYCVLARDRSECQLPNCIQTARTSVLAVLPRLAPQEGGRLIFDNLLTVCETHAKAWRGELLREARRGARKAAFRVTRSKID